jgi:broad specificity phosphatase PhoE
MTDLYVVRHGETAWSRSGQHTSVTDLPLTEQGRREAESLNGHLDPDDFGLVLSSPRQRAVDTAQLAGFGQPVIDEDLVEWAYGDYEGLTSEEILERDPDWDMWRDGCPGGESPAEVVDRLMRVVERVRSSGVDQAIAFAHGHSLRSLALCWLGLDISVGEQFPLHTASISVLGWSKGQPALARWNAEI